MPGLQKLEQQPSPWRKDDTSWQPSTKPRKYATTPVVNAHHDRLWSPHHRKLRGDQEERRLAMEFGPNDALTAFLTDRERAEREAVVKNGALHTRSLTPQGVGTLSPAHTEEGRSLNVGGDGKFIWVMDENGQLSMANPLAEMQRLSPGTQISNNTLTQGQDFVRFHHTSLAQGKPVAASGEMKIEQGALTELNNNSGHYQPNGGQTAQAIHELSRRGIDLDAPWLSVGILEQRKSGKEHTVQLNYGQSAQLLGYSARDGKIGEQLEQHNGNKLRLNDELRQLAADPANLSQGQLVPQRVRESSGSSVASQTPSAFSPKVQFPPGLKPSSAPTPTKGPADHYIDCNIAPQPAPATTTPTPVPTPSLSDAQAVVANAPQQLATTTAPPKPATSYIIVTPPHTPPANH